MDDPFINDEHVKFLKIVDDQQIAYLKEETRRINKLLKVWFAWDCLKLIDFEAKSLVLTRMARLSWQTSFHQITAVCGMQMAITWIRMFP